LKHLWYQVEEGDADVETFFHYVSLAAKVPPPGIASAESGLI
jgi:hypothetical protein